MLNVSLDGADQSPGIAVATSKDKEVGASVAQLVEEIAESFPNISELVESYGEDASGNYSAELCFALGLQVAKLRADLFAPLSSSPSLLEFVNQRLIPDLSAIGQVDAIGQELRVLSSIFTKANKSKKRKGFKFSLGSFEDVRKCDFLSGSDFVVINTWSRGHSVDQGPEQGQRPPGQRLAVPAASRLFNESASIRGRSDVAR